MKFPSSGSDEVKSFSFHRVYAFCLDLIASLQNRKSDSCSVKSTEQEEFICCNSGLLFFMQYRVLVCDLNAFLELWCRTLSRKKVVQEASQRGFLFFFFKCLAFTSQGEILLSYREMLPPLRVSFIFVNQNGFYCFLLKFMLHLFFLAQYVVNQLLNVPNNYERKPTGSWNFWTQLHPKPCWVPHSKFVKQTATKRFPRRCVHAPQVSAMLPWEPQTYTDQLRRCVYVCGASTPTASLMPPVVIKVDFFLFYFIFLLLHIDFMLRHARHNLKKKVAYREKIKVYINICVYEMTKML